MASLIDILAENPLLLLFTVAAIGFPLGRIKLGGAKLGAVAILFVGIAIGALDERLKLPPFIFQIGLAMLVYTIGLASAPSFFGLLNRKGAKRLLVGLIPLAMAGGLAAILAKKFGIDGAHAAGMYAGAFTNASGLASAVDALERTGKDATTPVIAYSMAYPLGILTPMFAMALAKVILKVDLAAEAMTIPSFRRQQQKIEVATLRVEREDAVGATISQLARERGNEVIFGRVRRNGSDQIVSGDLALQMDDLVTIAGPAECIANTADRLGSAHDHMMEIEDSEYDIQRAFVSRPDVVGVPLRDLQLPQRLGALVTHVRRGDLVFLPKGDTLFELGDRVRVLARRDRLEDAKRFFGDSYKALSEVDLLTFSFGMALGLAIGLIPIPVPGGDFRLGFAGGPLIAGLILGRIRRTGNIVWQIPYSANLTLRQFGLVLFSAAIGTRAGYDFVHQVQAGKGFELVGVGFAITAFSALATFAIGFGLLKIPLNIMFGVYAGAQTQPTAAAFATEQTKNDIPTGIYAALFPIATVFKILVGQMLLLLGDGG